MTDSAVEIVSEDGNTYLVKPFEATLERLEHLWSVVEEFAILRSDHTKGDFDGFMDYVMAPGTVILTVSQVDGEDIEEVGVLYADEIIPKHSARAHFIFWDLRMAGRQRLLLATLRDFMEDFELERAEIEVPVIGFAVLRRLYKMGIFLEGRLRNRLQQGGEWQDTYVFSILRDELTEGALDDAKIPRTPAEEGWFGLLEDEKTLRRYILRRRD